MIVSRKNLIMTEFISRLMSLIVEYIALRTLNYHKVKCKISPYRPMIVSDSFRTLSTGTTDHHEFYQDVRVLDVDLRNEKPIVACCSSLYQQVNEVYMQLPIRSGTWNSLWNIGKNNIH